MKFYKLLHKKEDGQLASIKVHDTSIEVIYKVGEFVTAPKELADRGYHLLVFDNLIKAIQIRDYQETGSEAYECEIEEIINNPPSKLNWRKLASNKFEIDKDSDGKWPSHTIMAKKVKLINKIG